MIETLIFDVGLHTGQDTEYYLKKGFNVVAIEANPVLVGQAQRQFTAAIASGQLKLLNVGVAEAAGTCHFYVNKTLSEWSSLDSTIGTQRGDYEVIEIKTLSLADVLAEWGIPYYLKIDIEGMDLIALKALRQFNDRPRYVSAENGQPHMLREMVDLGYSVFKFINQKTISEITLPEPAREGKHVSWLFPFGSSGPFGAETPGAWLGEKAVLEQINAYWGNPLRDPGIDGWFDLHAKLLGD